jgi:uncharacterized membrane protein YfcA
MALWAVPAGLAVGLALGALGGGGSMLTVPALVYLLGESVTEATTASLLIVGTSALTGMATHLRRGRVRLPQGLAFGALGIAGSYAGSRLSVQVSPAALLTAFAGLMFLVAYLMTRRRRSESAGSSAPGPPTTAPAAGVLSAEHWPKDLTGYLRLVAAATGVGLLTGFFGVGGGFAVVPALVLALGFTMPVAVGTSLLVIAVNSTAAVVTRLGSNTAIDWTVVGVFSAFAVAGSLVGAHVAHRVSPHRLSVAFTTMLVLVASYTAAMNIPRLW